MNHGLHESREQVTASLRPLTARPTHRPPPAMSSRPSTASSNRPGSSAARPATASLAQSNAMPAPPVDPATRFAIDTARFTLFELGGTWLECERRAHLLRQVCQDYRSAIDFLASDMVPDDEPTSSPAEPEKPAVPIEPTAAASTKSDPLEAILKLAREIRAVEPALATETLAPPSIDDTSAAFQRHLRDVNSLTAKRAVQPTTAAQRLSANRAARTSVAKITPKSTSASTIASKTQVRTTGVKTGAKPAAPAAGALKTIPPKPVVISTAVTVDSEKLDEAKKAIAAAISVPAEAAPVVPSTPVAATTSTVPAKRPTTASGSRQPATVVSTSSVASDPHEYTQARARLRAKLELPPPLRRARDLLTALLQRVYARLQSDQTNGTLHHAARAARHRFVDIIKQRGWCRSGGKSVDTYTVAQRQAARRTSSMLALSAWHQCVLQASAPQSNPNPASHIAAQISTLHMCRSALDTIRHNMTVNMTDSPSSQCMQHARAVAELCQAEPTLTSIVAQPEAVAHMESVRMQTTATTVMTQARDRVRPALTAALQRVQGEELATLWMVRLADSVLLSNGDHMTSFDRPKA